MQTRWIQTAGGRTFVREVTSPASLIVAQVIDISTVFGIFTAVVKNVRLVKIRAALEPWALGVIGAQPGFDAAWSADAELRVGGRTRPVVVEARRRVDAATAHSLVALARHTPSGRHFILIAERTSQGAREVLEAAGVAYLDGLGNASIRLPGVFVRTGSFPVSALMRDRPLIRARLAGKAGLVAQALLLDRDREWGVVDVSERSGVSVGLAHRVLVRLEDAGVMDARGSGPRKVRRLANPAALLDLWAEEEKETGVRRNAAYALMHPGRPAAAVFSERLAAAGIDHAITGTAAAAILAPALTSIPVAHVRVTAAVQLGDVLGALDAHATGEGANVVIIQAQDDLELRFRRLVSGIWLAASTRVYLDALRDPRRGREQAQAFRESALGF